VQASNQDIWDKVDELARQKYLVNKTRFKELEIAAGMNYVPTGVLANTDLRRHIRPADSNMCDPMHVLVSNGVLNFEIFELFTHCGWSHCYNSMRALSSATWKQPKWRQQVSISRPFDSHHQKASEGTERSFKCQASEMLSLLPLLRYFVDIVLARTHDFALQVGSFQAAHDFLHMVTQSKKNGNAYVNPARLDAAATRHLEAFKAAYGLDHLKPKHHQELHVADNARKVAEGEREREL
jgi:hypothetical protein